MTVEKLAQRIEARLHLGAGKGDLALARFYASNKMSELIGHAATEERMNRGWL